jgi:hypothetical protein
MKTWPAATVTAVLLVCSGCSGSRTAAPTGALTAAIDPANATHVTAQHNRDATRREVRRLLALAPVPAGATKASGPLKVLSGPAMGTPGTSSLIDAHRFWQTTMSMDAVYQYVSKHRPPGLKPDGTENGGGAGVTYEGISWSEPDTAYATGLQVDVSLASRGQDTLIRTDGLGEWLDPRPVHDTVKGQRLRVTVTEGCPASDAGIVGVRSPGQGLDESLLPHAAPTAALICAYGGSNFKPPFTLRAHRSLGAGAAARIARQANKLPISHTDGDTRFCPMDDGSFDVVVLSYSGHPDVDLADHATGCGTVANGHIVVNGGLSLTRWVPNPTL